MSSSCSQRPVWLLLLQGTLILICTPLLKSHPSWNQGFLLPFNTDKCSFSFFSVPGMSHICRKPPLLHQHPSRTCSGQDHDSVSPCAPASSCRHVRRLSELSAKLWRGLAASGSPSYQTALIHITWLSLNIPENFHHSSFETSSMLGTCRETSPWCACNIPDFHCNIKEAWPNFPELLAFP